MMKTNHQHITNKQLVEQFQNGHEDALKLLIKRFHPKMVRVISYHTQSCKPVDDLSQECWLSIIQHLGEVDLKISFEVWAITIARRKAIDWIRGQQRLLNQSIKMRANFENEHTVTEINKQEQIQISIRQLPATRQIVLNMFYLENLTLKEISTVLNVSEGTVKSRLFYARENLKNIINP